MVLVVVLPSMGGFAEERESGCPRCQRRVAAVVAPKVLNKPILPA